jgi:hypothetical protein
MGGRNRVGIKLSYLPARLQRLAESIPWNRFLDSLELGLGYREPVYTLYTQTSI